MQKKIILLIDDDCDDAVLFSAALDDVKENTILLYAKSGEEGLQMLSEMETRPELILLDAGMPGMNGWECLKLIKEDSRFKKLPVIMTATSSRVEGIDDARNLGAEGYIVKPSRFEDLKNIMQIICSASDGLVKEVLLRLQIAAPKTIFVFAEN